MSIAINRVFVAGNLTRDVELKTTATGKQVGKFAIAVNQKGKDDKNYVVFVDVTVWGKQAEACAEYLKRGSACVVDGRLQFDKWENDKGEARSKLYVIGERINFLRTDTSSMVEEPTPADVDEFPNPPSPEVPDDDLDNLPF